MMQDGLMKSYTVGMNGGRNQWRINCFGTVRIDPDLLLQDPDAVGRRDRHAARLTDDTQTYARLQPFLNEMKHNQYG
jgi:hypothetical protein